MEVFIEAVFDSYLFVFLTTWIMNELLLGCKIQKHKFIKNPSKHRNFL